MNRLVAYMLKLPVELFVTGIDVFLKGMREFQGVLDKVADDLAGDAPGSVGAALGSPALPSAVEPAAPAAGTPWDGGTNNLLPSEKEKKTMASVDLGGDDVKNVSYWITFVKPDFVATLQGMRDETIDYPTDEASFGGLKLARFFEELARKGIPWPEQWSRPPSGDYPKVGSLIQKISPKDEKYLKLNLRLNWRQPMPEAEREKDKVDALRDIREELRKWDPNL